MVMTRTRAAGSLAGLAGALTVMLVAPAASATTVATVPAVPAPVPSQYASEYALVGSQVQAFAEQAGTAPKHPKTTVGTELLAANGNIGPGLLAPGAIAGVETELDAFTALGIRGATVDVSFPLLLDSTPGHAAYLAFYEQVARQIRLRHLVFSVEENPIFSGTPLTGLSISYAGLTPASYAAEQRNQAQIIIDDLKPDYLSVLTEPDTYADTFHLALDTPAAASTLVKAELSGLKRHSTKVGAGTGTWSAPSIDRALLKHTSIDYLDVHVYPLDAQFVTNLAEDVSMAKAAHKPLVMDETWLNKPTAGEGEGPIGAPENLKVKSYSFWESLDEAYVSAMVRYTRASGFAYMAFFDGARAFFGYLAWSPALEAASYQGFTQQYNELVGADMRSLTVSGTGLALIHALAGP
jgi:hypothetical protein